MDDISTQELKKIVDTMINKEINRSIGQGQYYSTFERDAIQEYIKRIKNTKER